MNNYATKIRWEGYATTHDRCCPVCPAESAVLNIGTGIFFPSWKAQKDGWLLIKIENKFIRNLLKKIFKR